MRNTGVKRKKAVMHTKMTQKVYGTKNPPLEWQTEGKFHTLEHFQAIASVGSPSSSKTGASSNASSA